MYTVSFEFRKQSLVRYSIEKYIYTVKVTDLFSKILLRYFYELQCKLHEYITF